MGSDGPRPTRTAGRRPQRGGDSPLMDDFGRNLSRHAMNAAAESGVRRALVASACVCVVALAAFVSFSAGAPSARAAAGEHAAAAGENDRTLKLDLIERLKAGPEILVLGSSRGRRAAPAYLRKLTGHTGFNAAVTSGTAADAWVMTRYTAGCFPRQRRRYVWFVDAGVATNGINPDIQKDPRGRANLGSVGAAASADPLGGRRICGPGGRATGSTYNPDGSLGPAARRLPEKAAHLDEAVAKLVAKIRANPPPPLGKQDPRRYVYFERALSFMNARGERPVIVFNPIYPTVLAELRKYGFPTREASREYLTQLHKRLDFVVVDAEDIRLWGGSPRDFADPTHINEANMRRLLAYVVTHSDGALR
jgi:hypothetical protein